MEIIPTEPVTYARALDTDARDEYDIPVPHNFGCKNNANLRSWTAMRMVSENEISGQRDLFFTNIGF